METATRRYFLVERYVPSMSAVDIDIAATRLAAMADGETRHLGSLLIPGEDTCLSLFEAREALAVAIANDRADFPHHRIVEVRVFAPPIDPSV